VKLRSERDSLVEALSVSGRAVGTRTLGSAVLSGVLLETSGNSLTVTGTDLDLTIQVTTEVIGVEDGSCVVPAKVAADVVRSLEPGAVTLSCTEDTVEISAARNNTTLRSFPVVEFPAVGQPGEKILDLPAKSLSEGLRQVTKAASSDDARPLLTGILLTEESGEVRLVATDSYRLAMRDLLETTGSAITSDILVPARALAELQRAPTTGGGDGVVEVFSSSSEITFKYGGLRISTRLLEGKYPDYRQLIPDSYPNELHLGKESLLSALKRVRLLARDNTTPVRLSMRSGGVDLSVVSQEIGDSNETVDGDFSGDEITVAFNPSYLIDGVDAVISDEVIIEAADSGQPATVRGAERDDYRYLLMPVRVS
jgi:DNA polymerase-3 subunit beta